MKLFVQLILRKIIKIVATRCQILRLKCTKFDFGFLVMWPRRLCALNPPLVLPNGKMKLFISRTEQRSPMLVASCPRRR